MGDDDGVVRVGQLADALPMRLFALGHALVLAEVVVPGSDDELLEHPAGVARVVPGPQEIAPVRRRLSFVFCRAVIS